MSRNTAAKRKTAKRKTAKRTTAKRTTAKRKTATPPRKKAPSRKRRASEQTRPRETVIARTQPQGDHDAASSVTVKDEAEALFYFASIDERLADAWKRDVVMPDGPITIRRVVGTFFDATHYAYVDRRLIWYLKRDHRDPFGARWEGYLKTASDAPRGTIVIFAGRDVLAKKSPPQIARGEP